MATRMKEATPPFQQEVESVLKRVMPPNVPPLKLFTTLARDPRLFGIVHGVKPSGQGQSIAARA